MPPNICKTFFLNFVDQMVMDFGESPKKRRFRYSYQDKAALIQKYQESMEADPENCSMKKFASEANISKSMIFRWLKNKEEIFRKCAIEQGLPPPLELGLIKAEINPDGDDLIPNDLLEYEINNE